MCVCVCVRVCIEPFHFVNATPLCDVSLPSPLDVSCHLSINQSANPSSQHGSCLRSLVKGRHGRRNNGRSTSAAPISAPRSPSHHARHTPEASTPPRTRLTPDVMPITHTSRLSCTGPRHMTPCHPGQSPLSALLRASQNGNRSACARRVTLDRRFNVLFQPAGEKCVLHILGRMFPRGLLGMFVVLCPATPARLLQIYKSTGFRGQGRD